MAKAQWEMNEDGWPECSNCGHEAEIDKWEYDMRDKIRPATSKYCSNCGDEMEV